MLIKVESCWGGNSNYYYRLSWRGGRCHLAVAEGQQWSRHVAIRALDLLSVELPSVPRSSIRFTHH